MATLPGSRTRAIFVLALFAAIQLADGAATLAGVSRFGPSAEANPLLALGIAAFGAVPTLVTAKSIAALLATAMHVRAYYLAIALLTVLYVFGALDAWAFMPL